MLAATNSSGALFAKNICSFNFIPLQVIQRKVSIIFSRSIQGTAQSLMGTDRIAALGYYSFRWIMHIARRSTEMHFFGMLSGEKIRVAVAAAEIGGCAARI